jgi:hypothetical protein
VVPTALHLRVGATRLQELAVGVGAIKDSEGFKI